MCPLDTPPRNMVTVECSSSKTERPTGTGAVLPGLRGTGVRSVLRSWSHTLADLVGRHNRLGGPGSGSEPWIFRKGLTSGAKFCKVANMDSGIIKLITRLGMGRMLWSGCLRASTGSTPAIARHAVLS